jgi:glucose/mannose transport system substrate-binding protein
MLVVVVMLVAAIGPSLVSAQDGPSGEMEIFSWWAGDEGPALAALVAEFQNRFPDVTVNNATVTGGSGVNARAVLRTRMLGGDPPDTFQVHAGQELTGTWVIANRMEPLNFLYEEEGWADKFPQGVIDAMSYEGSVYSVPVNIHRSNVMWYNPAKVEEWGIAVPESWDQFLSETCPALQEAGVTPLAVGQDWTQNHLWESVALSVLGVDGWNALWAGELDPAGEEMQAVWSTFGDVLACSNIAEDAAGLSWQQATDKIVSGEAGFNIMGDWAAGYMTTTLGLTAGEDFGWAASPGTDGVYMWLADAFGLPEGAENRDAVVEWLRFLGSVDAQNIFNPLKGSIPARLDADVANNDAYNAYLQSAAGDWQTNEVAASLVHGAAANDRFSGEFGTIMEIFAASGDPAATASAFAAICQQSGACGG